MQQRYFTASDNRDPSTDEKAAIVQELKQHIVDLAVLLEKHVPAGRNRSIALTSLEDVQMRANRGLFAPEAFR